MELDEPTEENNYQKKKRKSSSSEKQTGVKKDEKNRSQRESNAYKNLYNKQRTRRTDDRPRHERREAKDSPLPEEQELRRKKTGRESFRNNRSVTPGREKNKKHTSDVKDFSDEDIGRKNYSRRRNERGDRRRMERRSSEDLENDHSSRNSYSKNGRAQTR